MLLVTTNVASIRLPPIDPVNRLCTSQQQEFKRISDRIVPAMTEESFADVHSYLGFADNGAIVTEAYSTDVDFIFSNVLIYDCNVFSNVDDSR